jgi:ABC-type transport system involved in multi-copper enzyme maturation permease subunit
MTALESMQAYATPASSPASPLLGMGPFIRKELSEWLRSWRAVILLGITSAMMVLNTLSARLADLSAQGAGVPVPSALSFDPTANVLVKWPQWVFFFAIVFSANLFIVERDRGTLAWSLSKPLSRTALLVGKWTAAMVIVTAFGIVLPMAAAVGAAVVAYGMPDLGTVALATVLLTATPAFFFALTLALATVLPSQPPVAGIAVGVAIAPGILGSFLPGIADWLPPTMAPWAVAVAMGQPVPAVTPIAWAVATVAAAVFGIAKLRRVDL